MIEYDKIALSEECIESFLKKQIELRQALITANVAVVGDDSAEKVNKAHERTLRRLIVTKAAFDATKTIVLVMPTRDNYGWSDGLPTARMLFTPTVEIERLFTAATEKYVQEMATNMLVLFGWRRDQIVPASEQHEKGSEECLRTCYSGNPSTGSGHTFKPLPILKRDAKGMPTEVDTFDGSKG